MTEPETEEGTVAARRPPPDALPSRGQLLRSTAIAAAVAGVLLVTVVLPAEYGIDPTTIGDRLGLAEMGELKRDLALTAEAFPPIDPPTGAVPSRTDDLTLTLAPEASSEVKLAAAGGAHIQYRWTATGPLTHHLHVDKPGGALSYAKGEAVKADEGTFDAAFLGWHGWYFHNPTDAEITVTLHAEGPYLDVGRLE